jgi:glycosyltransferase involved in cell wall biosynthesis
MNAPAQPLVSVVTPMYNADKYLRECIESVLAQTYQHWEYIIVNNCSTDRSLEIAQHYAAKDTRIRTYTNHQFVSSAENHHLAFRHISPEAKYCKSLDPPHLY